MKSAQIPDHLRSTENLISTAFPEGIPSEDYLPLLFLLSDFLCDENLQILASFFFQDSKCHANDVLLAQYLKPDTDKILVRLRDAGFDTWAKEEKDEIGAEP